MFLEWWISWRNNTRHFSWK